MKIDTDSIRYDYGISADPLKKFTQEQLQALASSSMPLDRQIAALQPNIKAEQLLTIVNFELNQIEIARDYYLLDTVAKHKNISREIADKLYQTNDLQLKDLLSRNPNAPAIYRVFA
jgi:glucan phosphorylase